MRSIFHGLLIASLLATSGCTLAGAAVGATRPHYQSQEWTRESVELGAEVRVRMRTVGGDTPTREVRGRYGGIHDGLMSVTDTAGHEHELPVRDVAEVEVRRGTLWKEGLLLGAAIDTLVVIGALAIANGADLSVATTR